MKQIKETTSYSKLKRRSERNIEHAGMANPTAKGKAADRAVTMFDKKMEASQKRKARRDRRRQLTQVVSGKDLKAEPRFKKKKGEPEDKAPQKD